MTPHYICPTCDGEDTLIEFLLGDPEGQQDYEEYLENRYDASVPGKCIFCGGQELCP